MYIITNGIITKTTEKAEDAFKMAQQLAAVFNTQFVIKEVRDVYEINYNN